MKQWTISLFVVPLLLITAIIPAVAQTDLGIELETVLGKGPALSSAWSPNGEIIAVGSSNGLWLYTNTLEDITQLAAEPATQLLWQNQGDLFIAANDDGVAIWNIATDTKLAQLDGYSFPAAWSPDGTMLALTALDNQIVLWDIAKQREHFIISVDQQNGASSIRFLAWNAEQIVGIVSDYDVSTWTDHTRFLTWNGRTGELLSAIQPASDTIGPSNASLAELANSTPLTTEIILTDYNHFLRFDTQNEYPLAVSESRNLDVYDLSVSPDRKRFAVIDQTLWQISIWDTETLSLVKHNRR